MGEVKERPILFSGPMVRAILGGRKTVTRRIVKGKFPDDEFIRRESGAGCGWWNQHPSEPLWLMTGAVGIARDAGFDTSVKCPYGVIGDRLWVRETWAQIPEMRPSGYFTDPKWIGRNYWYRADGDKPTWGGNWRPSIFMRREACRIILEITDIRAERLQEMTEEDAIREGAQCAGFPASLTNLGAFAGLWNSLNAKRGFGWNENPWVWRIEFRRI